MPHSQQGWAMMGIEYKHKTKRIEEKRQELEKRTVDLEGKVVRKGPAFHNATRFETEDTAVDDSEKTYWAECDKNETGDPQLSRWVSEIVRLAAEERINNDISTWNQENSIKIAEWMEKRRREEASGLSIKQFEERLKRAKEREDSGSGPKTSLMLFEVVYEAFDPQRLKMGSPKCETNRNNVYGKKLRWRLLK